MVQACRIARQTQGAVTALYSGLARRKPIARIVRLFRSPARYASSAKRPSQQAAGSPHAWRGG